MFLFETERLTVRHLTREDVPAMMAFYADRETVRYVSDSELISLEDCERWIGVTNENFAKRGYGMVAFIEKASGELVGCGGIVHPNRQPEAEVKYAFRKDKWGQGFATEAVSALINFGKENWGVGRLIATVDPDNEVSKKVLGKLGFVFVQDTLGGDGFTTQVWDLD